MIKHLGT